MYEIIAQGIGILGMVMNILSYQAKKQKNIIVIQFFGCLFFAINFFMLEAFTGAILNAIGVIRAVIYINKDKIKFMKLVNYFFIIIYVLSYFATFLVFKKEITVLNLIIEVLPVIAMIASTIAFAMNSAKSVRRFAFISSPSWLVYNCVNLAVGAIVCEIFTLISVILAVIRLDIKGGKNEKSNS